MARIVYTSGTFDLLHANHIKMINHSRKLGDFLIVGVSTDELVKSYKRPPLLSYEERSFIVGSLVGVDIVVPQRTLELSFPLRDMNVNIFVVGDDWRGKFDYLTRDNIEVFYFPRGEGYSSTKLKQELQNA